MIARLRGRPAGRSADGLVLDVNGVGYLVAATPAVLRRATAGAEVTVETYLHVREDALQLFGFADLEERRLFELLITVSGVGPKVALAVLSGLKPAALARAIREENVAQLVGIPGVGRKTAERLVVELRDKMELAVTAQSVTAPLERGVLPKSERFDDAVAALVRLGYSQAQAQDAVRKVAGSEDDLSLEAIVRQALARLSKSTAGVR